MKVSTKTTKGKDKKFDRYIKSLTPLAFLRLCFIISSVLGCVCANLLATDHFEGLELPVVPYECNRIPFVCCNEREQEKLLQHLLSLPKLENAVHVGWSIEFNYKILLARRPKMAFFCDVNQRVFEFYDLLKQLFLVSETGVEFIHGLQLELEANPGWFLPFERSMPSSKRFGGQSSPVHIANTVRSFSKWVLPEGNFEALKEMYREGRIFHVVLNVIDKQNRFATIADWIKAQGYVVDTLYLSNIHAWVKNGTEFRKNLNLLISENTLCIDANDRLFLRLTQGALPLLPP